MNLVELFDNIVQMQNLNGVPLAAGKLYVYALGRTRLMDTWSDIDGENLNPNPIILDNTGQAHVFVSDDFDYTLVVCDQYNNEIFSLDKYFYSKGEHSHADVAVAPSETIAVSSYNVGETTVYVPYLVGEVGKTYEGIEPIVVNNDVNRISAQHVPLGLQEPLFFVEDSESACVIGIDSSACGKTYSGISPILVDNTANTISITGDIGKDWTEEILSAANDASAAATAWTDSQGYLTRLPEDLVYTGDLNDYAKKDFVNDSIDSATSGLLPTSSFSSVSGSFLTALPSDLISSQSGTIFVSGYEIEGTNSAVTTATVQGFVTSFEQETIGPSLTATFSWDKSVPNTTFTFTTNYPSGPALVTYSANTDLTGEIMAPGLTATKFDISVPNATVIRLWSNNWMSITDNVASAADSVGMTVGELAWASALPTYQYDSSNKISAINGSALANYELPISVSAATDCVTANSAIWNSVTGKLETTAFSDVSGTFLTSLPANVAYTGWVENSIVSATSGLQSSGNYIPYTATEDSLTAFVTNSGLIVDHTAVGDGLKSTYIGGNVQVGYVGPHSTNRWAILSNNQLKFETDSNGAYDSAYLDKEKIHKLDSASDYIQNNSATINEVNTSYQTNSGSFLTAVDLTPYQTTAGMTAYQSAGDYYSASNPSGFITEVPAGTMNESAFEYDASDNITAYNGSAFAGGSELPQSATEAIETVTANSADWNGTTETVSSNSGTWGGSALPISAGPGVKMELVDDTLVFSNNETVLYTANAASNTIVLSEKATNFERLRLELQSYQSTMVVNYTEVKPNDNYLTFFAQTLIPAATYPLQILGVQFSSTNGITYNMSRGVRAYYKVTSDWGGNDNTDMTSNIKDAGYITKIIGINRKQ